MFKEFQKSALPTLFHFVRARAAFQPHVNSITVVDFFSEADESFSERFVNQRK